MDIKLNAMQLKKCIEPCNALVGKLDKGFDLKYTNIQLIVKDKQLDLYASDTNINIHTHYGAVADATQDIDIAVPADSFNIIFSDVSDPNDTVDLSFNEKVLKVLYKKQKYSLSYFYIPEAIKEKASVFDEPNAFSLFANGIYDMVAIEKYVPLMKMDYSQLKQIFSNLVPCMSKSPAESHIYGIYYDGNFYASNGYSFTGCYEVNNPFVAGEIKHLFFQNQIVQFILKLSMQGECSIGLKGKVISVKLDIIELLFTSNQVNYVPVSVLKSFITKNDQTYVVNTEELTPLIKKFISFSDFINKCYGELTFTTDNKLHISAADTNKKSGFLEYETEAVVPALEKETEIGITLDTVFAALQQIDTINTTIYYNSKTTLPLVFVNDTGNQFYYISPTKIKVKE
jgi:DNA polymerase III sliding clamp (beta) subunit (PCNA family)